jgi:Flp pilus assembly protein TadD
MSPKPFSPPGRLSGILPSLSLLALVLLLLAPPGEASAQGIGAHRGNVGGGTGGAHNIYGRIISPLGHLPETRIRVTLEHNESGTLNATTEPDGSFNFLNLDGGNYRLTVDAGKEYEVVRESIYVEGGQRTYNLPIYLRLRPEANPALAGVPKPALDLFNAGMESARAGDSAKAIGQLSEAVALHPQFGVAHGELGALYLKTNQLDKALEAFRAAQKSMPEDPNLQLSYGMALLEKKDFAEAEKQLRLAVRKLDKSAQAHLYLGAALARQKSLDEAEKELQQAVKLSNGQAGLAHKYLGGIYWARQDKKRAADELEKYLKLTPKAADAEQIRGTIKELRGKS